MSVADWCLAVRGCLMVAHFAHVGRESVVSGRHELAPCLQKVYEFGGRHALRVAGAEAFFRAKAADDGLHQALLGWVGLSFHHVEDVVSVCHNSISIWKKAGITIGKPSLYGL